MKVNENMSVLMMLEKARLGKDGKATVVMRLTIEGQRAELSLGIKVEPKMWNQDAGIVTGSSQEARNANLVIERARSKARNHFDLLRVQHDFVSVAMVKAAFKGIKRKEEIKPTKTLLECYDFVIERMEKKVGKNQRAKATLTKWTTSKDKVKAFLKFSIQQEDIPLNKLTYSFAEDFVDFLMLEQDIQSNTAMKYLKNAKHVVKTAVERDWLPKSPIASYPCCYVHPERDILTLDELMTMYHKRMPVERLEEVKNTYLLMCFTGYAYKDISLLTPEHVCTYFDGEEWIVKNREKTWCRENVPLLPIAKELIELYREHPYCRNKNLLMPVKSNQKFNAYLKEVADLCGINKNLTTHIARHTFATTITLSNGVPLETVSALLGHTSIKTTQIYAKIVAQKVSDDIGILKEKLALSIPQSLIKVKAA